MFDAFSILSVLPPVLVSTTSTPSPFLPPCTQDLPSKVRFMPMGLQCLLHLCSSPSSSWWSPFFDRLYHLDVVLLPGEIRYAIAYCFLCRDLISASGFGPLEDKNNVSCFFVYLRPQEGLHNGQPKVGVVNDILE